MVHKSVVVLSVCIATLILSAKMERKISFDRYPRYYEIQRYLYNLNSTHGNLVEVKRYGQSVEKRDLTYIKISAKDFLQKPLIFIDAGIHAREWITVIQALYIIHQLVENPRNRNMLNDVDWLIVPIVNPDGYEYAHTTDRYWRKNRAKGENCKGVDLNRNFDFEWLTVGASEKDCSPTYAGTHPFSEPESLALSKLIWRNAEHIKVYISFHSAAQAILYPWSCTYRLSRNNGDLNKLALTIANVIHEWNSTRYRVGPFAKTQYLGSGTSLDWTYTVANISLAFIIELKNVVKKSSVLRFAVHPTEILCIIEEMFEAIKVLPNQLIKYGYIPAI